MSYAVKELFLSLQGEGAQSGRRAVFVRFSGCNLWTGREVESTYPGIGDWVEAYLAEVFRLLAGGPADD